MTRSSAADDADQTFELTRTGETGTLELLDITDRMALLHFDKRRWNGWAFAYVEPHEVSRTGRPWPVHEV